MLFSLFGRGRAVGVVEKLTKDDGKNMLGYMESDRRSMPGDGKPERRSGWRNEERSQNMRHKYEISGIQMRYHMPKEVDQHAAEEIRTFLEQMIQTAQIRKLVFDFAETEFMDSSGIGVVIGRCRTLGYYDGKVSAANIGDRVDKIFQASGLYRIIEIEEAS